MRTPARSSRSSTTCYPIAVKFTEEGGQVTLRAARVPRAEVGQLSGSWTGRSLPLATASSRNFSRSASPIRTFKFDHFDSSDHFHERNSPLAVESIKGRVIYEGAEYLRRHLVCV